MNTQEFLNTMNVVLSGVSKKDVSEAMGQIVFDGGYLISYNDKIAVSSSVDCPIDSCGVDANDLLKAVKGIRTKEFEMTLENDFLTLEGGKTTVTLPTMISSEMRTFHEAIDIDGAILKMKRLPPDFIPALVLCENSVSTNMSSSFGGYAMKFDSYTVSSTDGYRASLYELSKKIKTKNTFFISKEIVEHLIGFNPEKIFVSPSWIYFTDAKADTVIACRTSIDNTENFPDLSGIIVKGKRKAKFTIQREDTENLDMLSFFTDGDKDADKEIDMVLSKKKVTMSGSSIKGSATIELPTDYKGEKIKFKVSSVFIQDIINSLGSVTFQLNDQNIYIEKGGNYKHFINLVG